MEIPRSILDELTKNLNKLSQVTQEMALKELEAIEWETIAELREKAIEVMDEYLSAATDTAAAYSAQTYDAISYLATEEVYGAEVLSGYNSDATSGAVRAMIQDVVVGNDVSSFIKKCIDRIDYDIKKAAANCTTENALNDPRRPRFARVPTGAETCDFCIMLASRGFVYVNEDRAGMLNHFHTKCDCKVIQGYKGMSVSGYDPDKLYNDWVESKHYQYMQGRADRLKEANFIRHTQKQLMKSDYTKEEAVERTQGLIDAFKEKYGKDYTEVYRKPQVGRTEEQKARRKQRDLERKKEIEERKSRISYSVEKGISNKKDSSVESRINHEYIQSRDYRQKFNKLKSMGLNRKSIECVHQSCVTALTHRSGTTKEDSILISKVDGTVVGKNITNGDISGIPLNDSIINALKNNDSYTLVGIHNHPSNIPPTGSDLSTARSRKYFLGVVALHNGEVFAYKIVDEKLSGPSFDLIIARYASKEYNDFEAGELALNDFVDRGLIECLKL